MPLDALIRSLASNIRAHDNDTSPVGVASALSRLIIESETTWTWTREELGWANYRWVGRKGPWTANVTPKYWPTSVWEVEVFKGEQLVEFLSADSLDECREMAERVAQ